MAVSLSRSSSHITDILTSSRPQESDPDVVRRIVRMHAEAVSHPVWRAYREDACKAYRYREGDQWAPEEIAELEQRGQPVTTRNEIKSIIDRVHGQFIQTYATTTFLGRNTPSDDPTAAVLADLGRHTDQQSGYEFVEGEITKDTLTAGVGWLEIDITENALGEPMIYEGWEDPLSIFPDPYFRKQDLTDMKFIGRSKWLDLEDAIALVPDKEAQLRSIVYGHGYELDQSYGIDPAVLNTPSYVFVDAERERVRPVEMWYRRKVKQYRVFTPDGSVVVTDPLSAKERRDLSKAFGADAFSTKPIIGEQMWKGIFCAGLLLYHEPLPRNLFPFLPCFCDRKKNGQPFGLVKNLIPIQDAINKRESKAMNMFSNRRVIAEDGVVKDVASFQDENARADGFNEVERGAISQNRIIVQGNEDIGAGNLQMLQEAKNAMPRVSGVPEEAMGFNTQVRSGSGIARKQSMTNLVVNPIVLNLRAFRHAKASVQLQLMKVVYTAEMTFKVTDDPNKARLVELTSDTIAAMNERIYDFVITDSKDYETVRAEQLDMFFELWPKIASLGPAAAQVALMMTDIREKETLAKMLQQASQPAPEHPKMSMSFTWSDLSDQEKAFFAMSSMQSPELAQFLAQRAGDPAWMAKIKAEMAKTEVKEGTRATVERGKVDLSAYKTAMEGKLRFQELFTPSQTSMSAGSEGGA